MDIKTQLQNYYKNNNNCDYAMKCLNILNGERPFYRDFFDDGHITGSAFIINKEKTHTLLIYHKFLDCWLQPGGHCDGEIDVQNVALREAMEETGLTNISPIHYEIFDVNVHNIPPNSKKNEPAHKHYDIRFLFEANMNDKLILNDDGVSAIKWFEINKLSNANVGKSVFDALKKIYQ